MKPKKLRRILIAIAAMLAAVIVPLAVHVKSSGAATATTAKYTGLVYTSQRTGPTIPATAPSSVKATIEAMFKENGVTPGTAAAKGNISTGAVGANISTAAVSAASSCTYPSYCDGGRGPGCTTITEIATYDTSGIIMWSYRQHTTYCWNDVHVTSHTTWETVTETENGTLAGWTYMGVISSSWNCFTGGDGVSCSGNFETSQGHWEWPLPGHTFNVYPWTDQWERYAGGYSGEYGG